jgi:hypothetical protein
VKVVGVHHIYSEGWKDGNRQEVIAEVLAGIRGVTWPEGNDKFEIAPLQKGKKNAHPNGVVPIRTAFATHMIGEGWEPEWRYKTELLSMHGALDALKETPYGLVAVEWETGNVSSSHRALGKLSLGLVDGEIAGGVLVILDSAWKAYFTDRIGNWDEVDGYQRVWALALRGVTPGFLSVVVMEPDGVREGVPPIPKGRDGNALAAAIAMGEVKL